MNDGIVRSRPPRETTRDTNEDHDRDGAAAGDANHVPYGRGRDDKHPRSRQETDWSRHGEETPPRQNLRRRSGEHERCAEAGQLYERMTDILDEDRRDYYTQNQHRPDSPTMVDCNYQMDGMRRRRMLDQRMHRVFRPPVVAPDYRYPEDRMDRVNRRQPNIGHRAGNRVPAPANRDRTKPPLYDGTTSWTDYLVQFDLVAELNGWDQGSMAMYLATSLRGAAQSVLGDLDEFGRRDYRTLVTSLNQRFGPQNQTQMFRALLRNRVRQPNETLPELAHEIKRLVKLAYPTGQYGILEDLAMNHFIEALPETESRWHIQQSRPQTLDEAVRVAVELEAFHMAEKQRGTGKKANRRVTFNEGPTSDQTDKQEDRLGKTEDALAQMQQMVDKGFQALEEKLSKMCVTDKDTGARDGNYKKVDQRQDTKTNPSRKPVECFHCGGFGHIRPECQKLREALARKRRGDQKDKHLGN